MAKVADKETTKKTTKKAEAPVDANGKSLVIVESPAKSKTIKKILGNSFIIEASYGHVRNLPMKDPATQDLGFDVKNNFEPKFEIIDGKQNVVKKLNDLAKKVSKVYLASDPDREGEAIAWHVRQILKVPEEKILRIVFNEITPKAVKHSVENPRTIDMDMVQAQQTRQILDKLVGYKLSPVLWRKLGNYHLSAGRVQSVALRMICEREEEIEAFTPIEYWSIHSILSIEGAKFEADVNKFKGKKIEIKNEEEATKIVDYLKNPSTQFEVSKVTSKETKRKPAPPFITSTLQREASTKLGYGVQKTMQIAQKLYEGIELGSTGAVGLITYMRTDSVRISDDAQEVAKNFITENYGEQYYPKTPNNYVKADKKNVQDAHEAIRPSYPERTPESIKEYLTPEQFKLYKLIWNRFMASQMENAIISNTATEIDAGDYGLRASTSSVKFDGYQKLYNDDDENEEKTKSIPLMKKGDALKCEEVTPKQHFTQPPPRYNEASLVKALEEHGIGRPSTYATIITVIQTRGYVDKKDKALVPTLLGRTVSKQLVEQFQEIMDYKFTAGMEDKLDQIAEKKAIWNKVLQDFYEPFMKTVEEASKDKTKIKIETDIKCPNCGKAMILRTSRFGSQFLGCSGYPECKTMMSMDVLSDAMQDSENSAENKTTTQNTEPEVCEEKCEKCGSDMIFKVGPYGKYCECTNGDCKHRKPYRRSTGVKCPKCGGTIVEKKSKRGTVFFGCDKYPNCDFVLWYEPTGEECPDCHSLLVQRKTKKGTTIECSSKTCAYKRVENNEVEDV